MKENNELFIFKESSIAKIGFENFRVFDILTEFELAGAGVTIITGPNNSGKSTILKAIELLQHSFEKYKSFDIIDFGLGVNNLATFDNAKFWNSDKNEILITTEYKKFSPSLLNENGELKPKIDLFRMENRYFKFEESKAKLKSIRVLKNLDKNKFVGDNLPDLHKIVSIEQVETNKWNIELYPEEIIDYFEGKVDTIIDLKKYKNILKVVKQHCKNDEFEKLSEFPSEFDSTLWRSIMGSATIEKNNLNIAFTTKYATTYYVSESDDELPNINFKTVFDWFAEFYYLTIVSEIANNRTVKDIIQFPETNPYKKFEDVPLKELLDKKVIDKFKKYLLNMGKILLEDFVNSFSKFDSKSFHKYKSLRKYTTTEGGVDELSKLLEEYFKKSVDDELGFRKLFVNQYMAFFEIGESVNIIKTKEGDYKLEILKNDKSISIADLGLGSLRVISIILFIATLPFDKDYINSILKQEEQKNTIWKTQKKIIIIEEPETNLHPAWQAKIAELFVNASRLFDIDFIIETHSEYLIRKLQYLTADKIIKPEDSVIYYFHTPDKIPKGEKQVKKIRIREDGSLTDDFGPGFFDEATNIIFDLWNIRAQN